MSRTLLVATRSLIAAGALALVVAGCGGKASSSSTHSTHAKTTSTHSGAKKPTSKTPGY
jgi:hypothetical protein